MVKKTNLFDNIKRVLSAARETGIFIAYVKLDLSPGDYRYPRRGEFCQFVAETGQSEALQRVKDKFDGNCEFEDLGAVARSLIVALNLQQGELTAI